MELRHIVAIGGGGFSEDRENPLLDDFVMALTDAPKPNVCFVSTASGDSPYYVDTFFATFATRNCTPTCLRLIRRPTPDPEELLAEQDVIYVGGGWTEPMLRVWRACAIDAALLRAWERGTILCGVSAGSMCWFEAGITAAAGRPDTMRPVEACLGLLPGSHCPHYEHTTRRLGYHRLVTTGALAAGHAAEGGVALHFVGTELAEAVTSRRSGSAYWVQATDGHLSEERLPTRYLG
ncbi:MAG TPA: peptidase E [Acidimicrobiia bacterium]|nr:peptidase E [Acidimicrobiia bacterium]